MSSGSGPRTIPVTARNTRAVRRLAPGSLEGRSEQAQQVKARHQGRPYEPVGTGQRSSSLVVAASNSSTAGKKGADYVCDGTADDEVIQLALDALGVLGAGDIMFLGGDYNLAATLVVREDTWLHGAGQWATIMHGDNTRSTIDAASDGELIAVTDMQFAGGDPAIELDVISLGLTIERCMFSDCDQAIVGAGPASGADSFIVYYLKILNNLFSDCGTGGTVVELGRRVFQLLAAHNIFDATNGGAANLSSTKGAATDPSDGAIILGNLCDGDLNIEESIAVTIGSNVLDPGDLIVTNIDELSVTGNIADNYTETGCTNVGDKASNVGTGF